MKSWDVAGPYEFRLVHIIDGVRRVARRLAEHERPPPPPTSRDRRRSGDDEGVDVQADCSSDDDTEVEVQSDRTGDTEVEVHDTCEHEAVPMLGSAALQEIFGLCSGHFDNCHV